MQEELITFETAKLAKEKGFVNYTPIKYDLQGEDESCDTNEFYHLVLKANHYAKPTQSLLQKWLREVHNIYVEPFVLTDTKDLSFTCSIAKGTKLIDANQIDEYDTYEEALEVGLQEALKLIK